MKLFIILFLVVLTLGTYFYLSKNRNATSAPTTSVPITSAPTTSAPTTSVPTTSVPTTSVPITSVPQRFRIPSLSEINGRWICNKNKLRCDANIDIKDNGEVILLNDSNQEMSRLNYDTNGSIGINLFLLLDMKQNILYLGYLAKKVDVNKGKLEGKYVGKFADGERREAPDEELDIKSTAEANNRYNIKFKDSNNVSFVLEDGKLVSLNKVYLDTYIPFSNSNNDYVLSVLAEYNKL